MKIQSFEKNKGSSIVLLCLFLSSTILGHPLDFGLIVLREVEQNIRVSLEMNPRAVADLMGIESKEFNFEDFNKYKDVWIKKTLNKLLLSRDALPCSWVGDTQFQFNPPQSVSISRVITCPKTGGFFNLETQFWKELPLTYQFLVRVEFGESKNLKTLDASTTEMRIEVNRQSPSFISFVKLGMEHIGATLNQWWTGTDIKLPEGIDHILFILALLLGGSELLFILKMVTGFTLGHTVTLILAAYQIVRIPSRWVESAIALSIAYVSAETLLSKKRETHWKVAFCFGLIHGLGFATALSPWKLDASECFRALVGFNLGVELGQSLVILIIFPILWNIRKFRFLEKVATTLGSSSIFLLGTYWFLRRAFSA